MALYVCLVVRTLGANFDVLQTDQLDLVNDGFSDEQFFSTAKDLIQVVYGVAVNNSRSYSVRALAVHVFFTCIEMLEMVKEDHPSAVNDFAKEILDLWVPFFNATLISPFPETDDPTFDGVVTLRVQIIRTIMQIRKVFGSLLAPFLGQIFAATWQELDTVKDRYVRDFVINESEGKLVDLDGLPYSLDLLVLEQLDFIQTCLKNKSVRDELARASGAGGPGTPLDQMVHATVALSQVASEDEGMWEVDLNVFLCEETSISANYTPRSASGDLILVRLLVHTGSQNRANFDRNLENRFNNKRKPHCGNTHNKFSSLERVASSKNQFYSSGMNC